MNSKKLYEYDYPFSTMNLVAGIFLGLFFCGLVFTIVYHESFSGWLLFNSGSFLVLIIPALMALYHANKAKKSMESISSYLKLNHCTEKVHVDLIVNPENDDELTGLIIEGQTIDLANRLDSKYSVYVATSMKGYIVYNLYTHGSAITGDEYMVVEVEDWYGPDRIQAFKHDPITSNT